MFCKTKKFCFLETGGLAFVDLAVQNIANFFKFFVVDFVFCHNYHGHSDLVAMVGGLQIVEGIGNQAHTAVELDAVFGHLVVGFFHFEHDLLFLLREEVEEDDFAEEASSGSYSLIPNGITCIILGTMQLSSSKQSAQQFRGLVRRYAPRPILTYNQLFNNGMDLFQVCAFFHSENQILKLWTLQAF